MTRSGPACSGPRTGWAFTPCLAVAAITCVGTAAVQAQTSQELERTAQFAASSQNPDGGFSAAAGGPSTLGATSSAARVHANDVAKVIRARLAGAPAPPPFRYKHAGDLATIGKRRAVIDFGWIKLKGALAWWLWGFAHIYFLIGVRNRLSVAINWLWIYARDQRGARLITWWGGEVEGTEPFPRREQP